MRNNRGLTLIEVILTLFVFTMMVSIFGGYCFIINRTTALNIKNQEIGIIAKNKMEEIKSGYIYIDNNRYPLPDFDETINFEEQDYNINISIIPLDGCENISCVNVAVCNKEGDILYNLVRYINLCKVTVD